MCSLPVIRLSRQITSAPSATSRSARCDPRNPAPPVITTPSRKPCRIAQDEIKAGKVKWVIPEIPKSAIDVASEMLDAAMAPE